MYRFFLKRMIGFILSLLALLFFSPMLLIVSVILFVLNNGKVFFTQERPGKNEKIFSIVKFKSMTDERDVDGNLMPNEKRLTKVGKFIRKTSIDEIPQLFNVLKGDMSLIGPRPLLPEYLSLYNEEQKKRHNVRPGITGWAQVNGRNTISWSQKFEYDVWYVKNLTFFLDVKILLLTIKKVFISEGINQEGQVTAEKFMGNE